MCCFRPDLGVPESEESLRRESREARRKRSGGVALTLDMEEAITGKVFRAGSALSGAKRLLSQADASCERCARKCVCQRFQNRLTVSKFQQAL